MIHSSQCDLVLGNWAVLPMVVAVRVRTDIRDGGHSPVLITLRGAPSLAVDWQAPGRAVPQIMQQGSREVLASSK